MVNYLTHHQNITCLFYLFLGTWDGQEEIFSTPIEGIVSASLSGSIQVG